MLAGFWQPVLEVVVIWIILYHILKFMQGTRGIRILGGVVMVYVGAFLIALLAQWLHLYVVQTVLLGLLPISLVALIVIFQPELRRGLIMVGESPFLRKLLKTELPVAEEILKAVAAMSERKIGALIAIERDIGLRTYAEGGVRMDARVSAELLRSIFWPGSPLHDGGVIVRGTRIVAAGCLFPLSDNPSLGTGVGTRHRAALGLTEESDAVCVVVSEETGRISVALRGNMIFGVDKDTLRRILREVFFREEETMRVDLVDVVEGGR